MQSPTCAFSAPASSVQSSKNQGAFGATKQGKDWPQIWFSKLAKFHGVKDSTGWHFTRQQTIEYLKFRKKHGVPAAKRALIVKGLILYRSRNLKSPEPQLEDIYAALSELRQNRSLA